MQRTFSIGPGSFTVLWPVEQLSAWPHQLPCAVSQTLPAPVQRHAFWLCRSFASLDHSQPSCLCTVERISVRSVVPKKKTIGGLYGREACCDFRSWSWLVLGLSWIRSTEVLLGNHQSVNVGRKGQRLGGPKSQRPKWYDYVNPPQAGCLCGISGP